MKASSSKTWVFGVPLHDSMIEEEHVELACPDSQDHRFFDNKHPFAARHTFRRCLGSQLGFLLGGHEVRASAEEDFIEGDDQQSVPYDQIDGQVVVELQLADAPLTDTGHTVVCIVVSSIASERAPLMKKERDTYSLRKIIRMPTPYRLHVSARNSAPPGNVITKSGYWMILGSKCWAIAMY